MRRWLVALAWLVVATLGTWWGWTTYRRIEQPIRVGVLHSRTGPMAVSEQPMIDAELMAIDEINARGGLLGRKVEAVIADGRSDPRTFEQEARRLIEVEKVNVIFGGWTALSRRLVKKVVEQNNQLFVFPSNYEGMDISLATVCTGPLPNQQVIPAVNWCAETLKSKKLFLAGSKDIQTYSVNAIIKDQIKAIGLELVGERTVDVDGAGMTELISAIKTSSPDVVLSTVAGEPNKAFYQQLAQAGLTPSRLPVVSFTIGEAELRDLPVKDMVGDYAAWSYFQSLDSEVNKSFVRRFKEHYGAERVTSDGVVAAYNAVRIWAQAAEEADTERPSEVRKSIIRQSLEAPEGVVSVDSENLHTWRPFYLGKIRGDGQFDIVWSLDKPVRPVPFPVMRPKADWEAFVNKLYTTWGTKEFNPQSQQASSPARPALAARPAARGGHAPSQPGARSTQPYQR